MSHFCTDHRDLAAFLHAKGMRMQGTEKEGERISFVFEPHKDLDWLVKDYHNNGLIPVLDVFKSKEIVTDLMYAKKRGEG